MGLPKARFKAIHAEVYQGEYPQQQKKDGIRYEKDLPTNRLTFSPMNWADSVCGYRGTEFPQDFYQQLLFTF